LLSRTPRPKRRRRGGEGVDHVTCRLCGRAYRAIAWFHLVRKHGLDPDHPILEYCRRFRLKHWRSLETRRKAKRSYTAAMEARGRHWNGERVLREIRARDRAGRGLSAKAVDREHPTLYVEARRFLGSWYAAVARAGVEPDRVRIRLRWSPELVVQKIREESARGRSLRQSDVNRRFSALVNAARRHHGGWRAALRAAGVDPNQVDPRRRWNRARVIQAVRRMNPLVNARDLSKTDPGLCHAVYRYVGSWPRAVVLAGRQSAQPAPRM
jgi:hypothetical protein